MSGRFKYLNEFKHIADFLKSQYHTGIMFHKMLKLKKVYFILLY